MAVVGSAEVVVRAITNQVRDDIRKAFEGSRQDVQNAGVQHGKDYSNAFGAGVGSRIQDSLRGALDGAGASQAAATSGRNAGKSFTDEVDGQLSLFSLTKEGERLGQELGDGMTSKVGQAAESAGGEAERALGGAGNRGGNAFQKALDSSFASSAISASKQFTVLIASSNLVGSAIGVLVSSLSSAVSGLFAMGAAASQAAGGLAVLPGIIGAAVQGMGTLKLAFSGVGAAVKAGFAPAAPAVTGAGSAARAATQAIQTAATSLRDALQGVAVAQENLSRVQVDSARRSKDARDALVGAYRDAAQSAADAADKVAGAEQKVLSAERELLAVQQELNKARQTAAEQLQQLGFDAEGAALAEQRAGIRLQDAHAALVAASSLPPDDRTRKEAELAFKEADLNYRQAKDRNSDLAKEQANAAKAGIDGSQAVLDAKDKIASAENQVIDAEKSLADARKAQARDAQNSADNIAQAQDKVAQAQLQNSRAISDAQRGVADAQERVVQAQQRLADAQQRAAQATDGNAKAANKYRDALANLSPAAASFVKYLVSLKDETKALKTAAGTGLFPGLQAGLEPIVKNIFPVLLTQLGRTGTTLGLMGKQFGQTIATGEGLRNITTILGEQNDTLDIFAAKGANGKSAIENLALVFTRLGVAIQPITQRFATWIAQLTGSAEAATRGETGMSKLTDFFQKAGDTAAQLGRIFGNLGGIIFGLGKAAQDSGHDLLDSFEQATQKLSDLIALPDTQKGLQDFFKGASENLKSVGTLLAAIAKQLLGLGDNPGVKGFSDNLLPAVDNIGKLGDAFTNAGPQLGAFAKELTDLFVNMTQGEAIQKFIHNLTAVLKVINSLTGSGTGAWILGIAASFAAFTRVAALVLIPFRFLFKALIGGPIGVVKGFQSMLGVFGRIPKAFSVLKGGGGLKAAFAAMSKGSKGAEKAFTEQMVTDKQKMAVLKQLELQALKTSGAMNGLKTAGAPAKGAAAAAGASAAGAASAATGSIGGAAGGAAAKAAAPVGKLAGSFSKLGSVFSIAGKGLLSFLGPIGLLTIAIPIVISIFKKLYNSSTGFRNFIDGLVAKFKEALDWIQANVFPVFAAIGKFIAEQFVDKVVPILKVLWDAFRVYLGFVIAYVKLWIDGIKWAVTNVLVPVWNNVLFPVFKILWDIVKFYIGLVIGYVKLWIDGIKLLINNVLIPTWNLVLLPIFKALWDVAKVAFDLFIGGWDALVTAIKWAWENLIKPTWDAFKIALQAVSDVATTVFKWIVDKFNDFTNGIVGLYNKFIVPFWDRFKSGLQNIGDKARDIAKWIVDKFVGLKDGIIAVYDKFISPLWDRFKNGLQNIGDKARDITRWVVQKFIDLKDGLISVYDKFIVPVIDKVKNKFEEIKTKVGQVVDGVKTIFDKLKDAPSEGIKNLVGNVNKYLIGNINKVGDVFGFHIPDIPIPQFAEGGYVRGKGGPKDDKILARLSNKEFVVNAAATARNLPMLRAINDGRSPLGVLPIGGWNPFEGIKDGVSGLIGNGLGNALEKIVKPFTDKFVPDNTYAGKFFRSIIPKLIETMKKWGDKKETSFIPEGSMTGAVGSGRSGAYGGVKPWVAAAGDLIRKMFGVKDIGGVGGRPNASDHPKGLALDFMVYQNKALGDRISQYMLAMHEALNVTYLIWYKRIVSAKNGWKWRSYQHPNGPTSNRTLLHMDHVHASFKSGVSMRPPVALAAGGLVRATSGGVLSLIGEAGRNERVEPLDREGLSNRDRALVALMENLISQGGGKGDTWQVFPSPGMDEVELAEKVSRRVAFKRRTGT